MDETQRQIIDEEIARRHEVIANLINLCAENKPADALATFGEEMTRRLRDIIADDKLNIQQNLLQPQEESTETDKADEEDLAEAIESLLALSEEELDAIFESDEVSDEEKDAIEQLIQDLMTDVGLEEGTFNDLKNAILEKSSDGPHLSGSPEKTLDGKGPTPTKVDGPALNVGGDMKGTLTTKAGHPNPPVGPKSGPSAKHLKAGDLSKALKK